MQVAGAAIFYNKSDNDSAEQLKPASNAKSQSRKDTKVAKPQENLIFYFSETTLHGIPPEAWGYKLRALQLMQLLQFQ